MLGFRSSAKRICIVAVVSTLAACSSGPSGLAPLQGPAKAESASQQKTVVRVMTYNVNEGTDFIELRAATTPQQFLLAVGQTITQVRATKPAERMQAVASQIIAGNPALVSLQEVDVWSSGAFDPVTKTCGPTSVEYNMPAELLAALAAQGAHYAPAVARVEIAVPPTPGFIPPSTLLCVAFVDEEIILARTDLSTDQFSVGNPQQGTYTHIFSFNTPIGVVPVPRGWTSVDATTPSGTFRFINTHLESFDATIRDLQGGELRAGPANTSLPVIIAMDGNARAAPLPLDQAYSDFLSSGYQDAWTTSNPGDPGFTCCQAQLDNNQTSQLDHRIDLILTQGSMQAQQVKLYGATPNTKTSDGLWPSDHAGVVGQLFFK